MKSSTNRVAIALALLCPTCAASPAASAPDIAALGARAPRPEIHSIGADRLADAPPCYAEKSDPSCGAPTRWNTTTCHWKTDCRMKAFGPAETLSDFVASTSSHAAAPSASPCADYFARVEEGWTRGDPTAFGTVSLGYAHQDKSESWVPDDPTAYYGPGTQTCTTTFRGVVRYRTFSEYNESLGFSLDDYADNACPSNDAAPFTCFDHTQPTEWPACRRPEFGLDPSPSACGAPRSPAIASAENIARAHPLFN